MSAPRRIEYPGTLYHDTARGIRRDAIYEDDGDRRLFRNHGSGQNLKRNAEKRDVDGTVAIHVNSRTSLRCLRATNQQRVNRSDEGHGANGFDEVSIV